MQPDKADLQRIITSIILRPADLQLESLSVQPTCIWITATVI